MRLALAELADNADSVQGWAGRVGHRLNLTTLAALERRGLVEFDSHWKANVRLTDAGRAVARGLYRLERTP